MKQGTQEWLQARSGKITASRFADVLTRGRTKDEEFGNTAMNYAYNIVSEILTGEVEQGAELPAMAWGHTYEPDARMEYQMRTFNKVVEDGFILKPDNSMIGYSPDGLVSVDGLIEIKCPYNTSVHLRTMYNGKMPDEHIPQVQGGMYVTGRMWCDFISYDPRLKDAGLHLFVARIYRDDAFIKMLDERLVKFIGIINNIVNKWK